MWTFHHLLDWFLEKETGGKVAMDIIMSDWVEQAAFACVRDQ